MENSNRLLWTDIIRIFSIFFVIFSHIFLAHESKSFANIPLFIFFTFVRTCVPLFVMVSGALLLGKHESNHLFFQKRLHKVFIPWIIWTVIYLIYRVVFFHLSITTLGQLKALFILVFFTQLWFLPVIFGLYIFTPILRSFVQNSTEKHHFYFILLWFVLGSVLPFIHPSVTFPIPVETGFTGAILYYTGYYILGYFLKNIEETETLKKESLWLVVSGVLITLLTIWHFETSHIVDIGFNYLAPGIILVSSGVFLILRSLEWRFQLRLTERQKKFVQMLSGATLGIYILNEMFISSLHLFVPNLFVNNDQYNVFFSLSLSLGVFIICAAIVLLFQRNSKLKTLFP